MKIFEAHIDYTGIIKDNNWLNDDFRLCNINLAYNNAIKHIAGYLTQKQIDHLAFMYQHGASYDDIKIQAIEYEKQNKTEDIVLEEAE